MADAEVEVQSVERATFLASRSILNSAKKLMRDGGDEREMYDMAIEKTANDYNMKMGEIEVFMDSSKQFLQGMDMDNGIYAEDGLKQLAAWEAKSKSLLILNDPKTAAATNVRVDAHYAPALPQVTQIRVDSSAVAFDDLLDEQPAKKAGK